MKIPAKQKLSKKLFSKKITMVPTRNGYGEALVELGEENEKVVVLCCDLTESTRSNMFAEKYPERFIEVGVAEQNLAGLAVGISMQGFIPFISSYAVFSPGRNWGRKDAATSFKLMTGTLCTLATLLRLKSPVMSFPSRCFARITNFMSTGCPANSGRSR